jgi:hypothetical protein
MSFTDITSKIFQPLIDSPVSTLNYFDHLRSPAAAKKGVHSVYIKLFDIASNESLKKSDKMEKLQDVKEKIPTDDAVLRSYYNYIEHYISKGVFPHKNASVTKKGGTFLSRKQKPSVHKQSINKQSVHKKSNKKRSKHDEGELDIVIPSFDNVKPYSEGMNANDFQYRI